MSVHVAGADFYYVLYRGESISSISTPTALALGIDGIGELTDTAAVTANGTGFFRVRRVPRSAPLDLDRDGIDDVYELGRSALLNPLNALDAALDPDANGKTHLHEYILATTAPATLRETSPKHGEGDVAVTRETIFRLSQRRRSGNRACSIPYLRRVWRTPPPFAR